MFNEAFNERREEFLEAIRQELKNEYDVVINELRERIESIEATATEEVAEAEEEEVVDEVVAEEEEDVVEEGENFLEGIEQAKAEAEASAEASVAPAEEEEAEDDGEGGDVEKTITDIINKKLEEIFTNKKSDELHFKYEEEAEESVETETTKKRFTPRELAELFTQ